MTSLTTITTAPVTMSSREIAELTGKLHKNVIRDIRTMLDELAVDGSNLSHVREEVDSRGYTAAIHLPRREVEILLTGYSIPLRAKVIDRLHELEQAQRPFTLPRNFSEALRLAAELEEQKEQLRLQNEAMKPAAEVGAAVGKRTNITVPDFAKKLKGVNTQQVQNWLAAQGVLYKDSTGKWCVYARYRDVEFAMAYDGLGRSSVIALEKGQQRIVKAYREGQLPMKKGCTPDLSAVAT